MQLTWKNRRWMAILNNAASISLGGSYLHDVHEINSILTPLCSWISKTVFCLNLLFHEQRGKLVIYCYIINYFKIKFRATHMYSLSVSEGQEFKSVVLHECGWKSPIRFQSRYQLRQQSPKGSTGSKGTTSEMTHSHTAGWAPQFASG